MRRSELGWAPSKHRPSRSPKPVWSMILLTVLHVCAWQLREPCNFLKGLNLCWHGGGPLWNTDPGAMLQKKKKRRTLLVEPCQEPYVMETTRTQIPRGFAHSFRLQPPPCSSRLQWLLCSHPHSFLPLFVCSLYTQIWLNFIPHDQSTISVTLGPALTFNPGPR